MEKDEWIYLDNNREIILINSYDPDSTQVDDLGGRFVFSNAIIFALYESDQIGNENWLKQFSTKACCTMWKIILTRLSNGLDLFWSTILKENLTDKITCETKKGSKRGFVFSSRVVCNTSQILCDNYISFSFWLYKKNEHRTLFWKTSTGISSLFLCVATTLEQISAETNWVMVF